MTLKSPTTTNPDWLHNSHAGEMLWLEFMEPLGLQLDYELLEAKRALTGELDRITPRAA